MLSPEKNNLFLEIWEKVWFWDEEPPSCNHKTMILSPSTELCFKIWRSSRDLNITASKKTNQPRPDRPQLPHFSFRFTGLHWRRSNFDQIRTWEKHNDRVSETHCSPLLPLPAGISHQTGENTLKTSRSSPSPRCDPCHVTAEGAGSCGFGASVALQSTVHSPTTV